MLPAWGLRVPGMERADSGAGTLSNPGGSLLALGLWDPACQAGANAPGVRSLRMSEQLAAESYAQGGHSTFWT